MLSVDLCPYPPTCLRRRQAAVGVELQLIQEETQDDEAEAHWQGTTRLKYFNNSFFCPQQNFVIVPSQNQNGNDQIDYFHSLTFCTLANIL